MAAHFSEPLFFQTMCKFSLFFFHFSLSFSLIPQIEKKRRLKEVLTHSFQNSHLTSLCVSNSLESERIFTKCLNSNPTAQHYRHPEPSRVLDLLHIRFCCRHVKSSKNIIEKFTSFIKGLYVHKF